MCDKVTGDYLLIGKSNGHHEDIFLDTYYILLSGKNNVFNSYVQWGKDDWELGVEQNFEDVMEHAMIEYNNMVK